MQNDSIPFDQGKFESLVQAENWLGAWSFLKAGQTSQAEQGALIGILATGLQHRLSEARKNDDREKISYLRSLLAWILRDYPGLASLYREQLRPSGIPGIPDGLQDIWREFSDVISGRKTMDESFKERVRDAASHLSAEGVDNDAFKTIARDAETELRKGMDGVREFLGSIWGNQTPAPEVKESDIPAKKIRIQDADDPLPGAMHMAEPPEDQAKR